MNLTPEPVRTTPELSAVPKSIINVILVLITIALACYAVYWLIKGDQSNASLCMLGSLFVFLVVRPLLT